MAGRTVGLWFPNNDRRDLRFFVGRTLIGLRWMVICLSFLVSTVQMVAAQSALEPVIPLTAEEQAWLKAHPDITLGYTDVFEPEVITNPDGSHRGILVDFLDELNRRLGTRIRLRIDPIPELLGKAQKRETDGILNILPEYADKLGLLKTEGYMTGYGAVFTRKNIVFDRPSDLAGKKVAIVDKVMFTELIVERYGAGATILKVNDALEGLQRVDRGEADLFLGASINAYFLSKYQLFGLALQYVYYNQPYTGGIAIRSDWPELVSIINKGISSFSQHEIDGIVAKWIQLPPQKEVIALNSEEKAWLAAHPDIELGYTDAFEPELIVNPDGSYRGTLVDVLDLLNQRLGTDFKVTVKPIPDLIKAVSNKELAGVLAIHPDYADKLGWLSTQNHVSSYPTVFARKGTKFTVPTDLEGKKIALIDKVFFSQNLVDLFGDGSTLIKVENALKGLERVKDGTADLFIGASANSYLLTKYQFFDLAAVYQFYEHPNPNGMGVRNDWPQLVSILNKGLASISAEEKESILRKWGIAPEQKNTIELTNEEQAWLKANPRITVGISQLPPYMFAENGKIQGSLVDMMESLARQVRLTADFSMQPAAETMSKIKSGQLHVALGVVHSQERAGFMYFSENVMGLQMSIFARTSRSDIGDAASLENKVIASFKGYGFEPVIKKLLPSAKIIWANDTEGMLRLVASGEADAAVQELHSGEFILRDSFINGVARKGSFDHPSLPAITGSEFGVSKKFPLLNSILNKSYHALPESEKNRVWRKWFAADTERLIKKQIQLTSEEQAWLREHPEIHFAFSADYPPALILDEDGHLSGMLKDVIDLLNQRLGSNFGITVAEIKAVREMVANKEVAGQLALTAGNGARRGLLETNVLWETYPVIYAPKDSPMKINALEDLKGKAVSTLKGSRYAEKILAPYQDKIDIVRTDTIVEAFKLLYEGKVDYMIGLTSQSYYLTKMRFLTLEPVFVMTDRPTKIVMGVRDDWPKLVEILNKGLKSITEDEWVTINDKWLGTPDVIRPQLSLTLEEKAWIDQNHKIRVRVADWPPYLIIKENDPPQGIAIEYLKLVEERTGLKFEYEMAKQSFAEFLESIKLHQGPDMTPLIAQSPDREQYLSFTTPYISSPYVIFARQQEGVLIDINGLSGKTLAVPKGFIIQQLLEKDYPEIRLVLFENDEQSLLALSTGKVDAYIGNLTVASHLIQKRGLSNLRVVAPAPYGDHVLSMGNRNDWPELTTIIDKALASITEAEKTAIRDKYVALRYEQGMNKALVVKWVLIACFGASGVVLFFVIWNRSLAGRVKQRTIALESTAESLKTEIAERNRTEAALQKSRRFTDNLIESANVMIVGLDDKGTVNLLNPAAEKITGYTISELHGKNWLERLVPKDRYPQVHLEFSRLMAGGRPKSFPKPHLDQKR